ncbi:MAG: hypothetical protein IJ710_02500 [Prevotella sp.]|nr:hypothetical protein [Prevotella sp.]
MKKIIIPALAAVVLLTSCATVFSGSKANVTVKNDDVSVPVTLSYDGKTEQHVFLPYTIKMKRGFSNTTITASAEGYEDGSVSVSKKFNGTTLWNIIFAAVPGMAIDAATGAITKPASKEVTIPMKPKGYVQPAFVQEEQHIAEPVAEAGRVTRETAGQTDLERTIIRWFFDSDPKGARIFWRVISSVPAEVKNTNELYLGTTPFEETRSFNILGLTYANSRDVQIEIKLSRKGYLDQVKRFNVRQAIDQQEISSFFDLVKE